MVSSRVLPPRSSEWSRAADGGWGFRPHQAPLLSVRCSKHPLAAFDLTPERFPNVGADECPIPRSPLGGPIAGQVLHHLTDTNGGVLIFVVKVSVGDWHVLIAARDGQ